MKTKNRLLHWLVWLCSGEYREHIAYKRGWKLWQRLSQGLPKPLGITEKDENRVKEFAARFKTQLTRKEQTLLVKWLQDRLYNIDRLHNIELVSCKYCKDLCRSIIESERKWATICLQHFMAVR